MKHKHALDRSSDLSFLEAHSFIYILACISTAETQCKNNTTGLRSMIFIDTRIILSSERAFVAAAVARL